MYLKVTYINKLLTWVILIWFSWIKSHISISYCKSLIFFFWTTAFKKKFMIHAKSQKKNSGKHVLADHCNSIPQTHHLSAKTLILLLDSKLVQLRSIACVESKSHIYMQWVDRHKDFGRPHSATDLIMFTSYLLYMGAGEIHVN